MNINVTWRNDWSRILCAALYVIALASAIFVPSIIVTGGAFALGTVFYAIGVQDVEVEVSESEDAFGHIHARQRSIRHNPAFRSLVDHR